MGQVISATNRFSGASKCYRFLSSARELLDEARLYAARGEQGLAFESAYRAALRTAGARVAMSKKMGARKRLPSSAWDQLALVDDAGKQRAAHFSTFSQRRSRVAAGIEDDPSAQFVQGRRRDVEDFLVEVEAEAGWVEMAA